MTFADIWATFSSLITSLVAVATLIGGVWVSVGRPILRRLNEERKERQDKQETEDASRTDLKREIGLIKTGVEAAVSTLNSLSETVLKHDTAIFGKGGINDQLSFLRGRESARTDITQAASIAAAIVKETAAAAASGVKETAASAASGVKETASSAASKLVTDAAPRSGNVVDE